MAALLAVEHDDAARAVGGVRGAGCLGGAREASMDAFGDDQDVEIAPESIDVVLAARSQNDLAVQDAGRVIGHDLVNLLAPAVAEADAIDPGREHPIPDQQTVAVSRPLQRDRAGSHTRDRDRRASIHRIHYNRAVGRERCHQRAVG